VPRRCTIPIAGADIAAMIAFISEPAIVGYKEFAENAQNAFPPQEEDGKQVRRKSDS